jgi:putative transposase
VPFGIGSRVVMDGLTWTVIELQSIRVTLSADGRHRCVDINTLAEAGKDVVIDGRPVADVRREVELIQLDDGQREALDLLRGDFHEWRTGYRLGSALAAQEGEPRDDNPRRRIGLIAADRRVSVRTMYRRLETFEKSGPKAVIDGRTQRHRDEKPSFDRRFLEVAERMLKSNRDGSTVKRHSFYIDVCAEVRNVHTGKEPVPEPSHEMFRTWLSRLPKGAHHFGKATTRRNAADAAEADRHLGGLVVSRPGEIIMIDSNRLDVLALDPVTGRVLIMVWTLAWDLYTTWPVALRVTAGDPTDVDIALLLSDVVRPRPRGAAGECRFWGVPDDVVVRLGEGWGIGPPAYAPFVIPQAILVDRAKAGLGQLVRAGAEPLRCDVMEAHPRTGSDKARLERNFGSMGTMFLQHFPGYKGSNVEDRGRAPQDDALLMPDELEDAFWHWVELIWQKRPHPGLRDPAFPQRPLSPEERYEIGVARAGFHHLPIDRHLWLRLLPVKLHKVGRSGFRLGQGLTYDSPDLDPYRRDSGLPGADGKWRIRVDRRDVMHVWLEDHETGQFVRVPWAHYKHGDPLFGERGLHYLRRRLSDQHAQRLVRHTGTTLDNTMIEFVRLIRAGEITLPGAERVMKKAFAEGRAAQRDAQTVGSADGDADIPRESAATPAAPVRDEAGAVAVPSGEDPRLPKAPESLVADPDPMVDMRDDAPDADLEQEDDAATWFEPQDDGPTYGWL